MPPALTEQAKERLRNLSDRNPSWHYYTLALQLSVETGIPYTGMQVKQYLVDQNGDN